MMNPRRAAVIAMREFSVRVHSRSYLLGTLALVIATAAIAFAPVIVQALDRGSTERIAVYAPAEVSDATVASLGVALNVRPAPHGGDAGAAPAGPLLRHAGGRLWPPVAPTS